MSDAEDDVSSLIVQGYNRIWRLLHISICEETLNERIRDLMTALQGFIRETMDGQL